MKLEEPTLPQGTNSRAVYPDAEATKERSPEVLGLAGIQQESLPQQAEVTIGLLPACFPGKVTQWHRCPMAHKGNRQRPRITDWALPSFPGKL